MQIAVLGTGSIGLRHLCNLWHLGEKDLIVYDPSIKARREAEKYADVFEDIEKIWEHGADAVLICTPPSTHEKLMMDAFYANADVFVEKPLSDSAIWSCPTSRQIPGCRNWVSMVACNMRFHPALEYMKSWLDTNAIGKILSARFWASSYLPNWHLKQDYKQSYSAVTGAILDCGSHELDLALWLLGPATLKNALVKSASSIGLSCDGLVEMLLQHDNGSISSVHADFISPIYSRGLEILGTKGRIFWDWGRHTYGLRSQQQSINLIAGARDINTMYVKELEHFLKCVRENTETCNPLSQAIETLRILLEARDDYRDQEI